MFEYKIISERDKRFAGGFDVDALEKTLNSYAANGWRLSESLVAANIMKSSKSEVLLVLERSVATTT